MPSLFDIPGASGNQLDLLRSRSIERGIRIEVLTILWMLVEMAVSIGAGIAAHSPLLIAFGLDSLIELYGAGLLFWRLRLESRAADPARVEAAEQRAGRGIAVALALLCVYVFATAVYGLLAHVQPDKSPLGIVVSLAAVILMPLLAFYKRRISMEIDSEALAGDAVNSITCAAMAGTVLLGLALNSLLGWWWIEHAAALVFLLWLVKETREAIEEVSGR